MKDINLDDFKFAYPLQIRWNDFDPLGHVNNMYYFEYFQLARGEYMPTASPTWNWMKDMFVIAHIECDYYKELKMNIKEPKVKMRTAKLSNKSLTMEYIITSMGKDGEIVHAKGSSVAVMIEMGKGSIAIPDWLRSELTSYEPAL